MILGGANLQVFGNLEGAGVKLHLGENDTKLHIDLSIISAGEKFSVLICNAITSKLFNEPSDKTAAEKPETIPFSTSLILQWRILCFAFSNIWPPRHFLWLEATFFQSECFEKKG
jgi:hypothetical protein